MLLEDLETEYEKQKNKLDIFISMKENDKLMENTSQKVLYIEPPGYFQFLKRWWYGEDKQTTFNHLDKYFTSFIRFLDNILGFVKTDNIINILPLGNKVCKFINCIIPGIHVLKATYPNYIELHNKIASIIITLIDFKTEFRQQQGPQVLRRRSPSF